MQNNAAFNVIAKYAVPRNKDIPTASLAEVLTSEPLVKNQDGTVAGSPLRLFEGRAAPLPMSALLRAGKLFAFKLGWLYVPDERQSEARGLVEAARAAALLVLPAVAEATGSFSKFVEEIGKELLAADANENGNAQKSSGTGINRDAYLKMLNDRGTVCLPGVDLVEVEHQVVPRKWLAKEGHRLIMTYEQPGGEHKTYSMIYDSPHAQQIATGQIAWLLESRWLGEFSYLLQQVKLEQIGGSEAIEAIGAAVAQEYKAKYGDKVADHFSEVNDAFQNACDAELKRKGGTLSQAGESILGRLAPMIPYYEQVPVLNQGLSALRGMAAGKTE